MSERSLVWMVAVEVSAVLAILVYGFWPFDGPPVRRFSDADAKLLTEQFNKLDANSERIRTDVVETIKSLSGEVQRIDERVITVEEQVNQYEIQQQQLIESLEQFEDQDATER